MKRIFVFLLIILLSNHVYSQAGIQTEVTTDVNGRELKIGDFAASKIVFLIVDASPASIKHAKKLDSLVGNNTEVQIIGIAVTDFGVSENDSVLARLYNEAGLQFPIVSGSKAKKENGSQKSSIVSWLTSATRNRNYSLEVEEIGQMFILNEKRELYAVVKAKALESHERINRVLTQKGN